MPYRLHPRLLHLRDALLDAPGKQAAVNTSPSPARAAVALIVRPTEGDLDLLLIRRAERHDDPWSGHVALPGGRFDPRDHTLLDTAIRETVEETGVDLRQSGTPLGVLDELHPRTPVLPPIVVTPWVFALSGTPVLVTSDEVAAAFWVPLSRLEDPRSSQDAVIERRGQRWHTPAFILDDQVVWGMTERILRDFLNRLAKSA